MASDDTDLHTGACATAAAEQLGDGFSPPAAEQQFPRGETDVLAAAQAGDDGLALGSQSDF